jgi:tRNA nucleotidyltransferase (CCA-adding enzyme)
MADLLPALQGLPRAYLVGGAVRDMVRGAGSVDLDIAVEGDAVAVARTLAERLGGEAREHERFGTATLRSGGLAADLATTRRERYERPGALPVVEPASLADDLVRRDFTINAMAVGLAEHDLGELHDPHGGLADLESGVVRVLHERSFVDDPTRLLRALRYEARLGMRMDPRTEELARAAAADGALETVSGPRIRDELMDLLREVEAPSALERARELAIDSALHPSLAADPELAAAAALGAAESGADRGLAALAALVSHAPGELEPWVESLALGRAERDAVMAAARQAPGLVRSLRGDPPDSAVHALLRREPPEALALALALGAPAGPIHRYLADLRAVRLEVTGDDLVTAGIPPSPAVGRALEETLRRKLDGEVSGREEELALALEIARREGAG